MPPARTWLAPIALAVLAVLTIGLAGCGDDPTAAPAAPVADAEPLDRHPMLVPPSTTTTAPPTTTTSTTTPPSPPPPIATARRAAPAPPPPPPPPPPPAPNVSDEARALELVNGERARAGLAPLQVNGGARSVARAWSAHMAGSGLAHNPDLGGDLRRAGVSGWSSCAENVGYSRSVDSVHSLFMGSSAHRNNILNPAYSQVGIGVVRSGGQVWVTMDLVGY